MTYQTLNSKFELGRQSDGQYDRQRFENYTSWLDMQVRAGRESRKRFFGEEPKGVIYGYAEGAPPPETIPARPFSKLEPSFTNGDLVYRAYDANDSLNPRLSIAGIRSDPYHYPNAMCVKEKDHFMDRRAGSRHPDPRCIRPRPVDAELKAAVPEEMVANWVRAEGGVKLSGVPPERLKDFFDGDIRPNAAQVRQYNVDLSCVHLPLAEAIKSDVSAMSRKMSHVPSAASRWKWCKPGKNSETSSEAPLSGVSGMSKVRSSPELMQSFSGASARSQGATGRSQDMTQRTHDMGTSRTGVYSVTPELSPEELEARDHMLIESMNKLKESQPRDVELPGGTAAKQGFAGTWNVCQGGGPGFAQFAPPTKPMCSPW
jgi:hypothetical protein